MKSAFYARVSSDTQDYEDQLAELRAFVQRQGWTNEEYLEKLSGKEGNLRPALEQLLKDAQNKRFDVVVVWKLDRFGRSTLDTLTNIKTLSSYGVRFLVSTQPAIDTDDRSPLGKFILQILAAVAELDRAFIIERTQTGFKSYRAAYAAGRVGNTRHSKSGKDLPVGRPKRGGSSPVNPLSEAAVVPGLQPALSDPNGRFYLTTKGQPTSLYVIKEAKIVPYVIFPGEDLKNVKIPNVNIP